jgi:hypothetical protein
MEGGYGGKGVVPQIRYWMTLPVHLFKVLGLIARFW